MDDIIVGEIFVAGNAVLWKIPDFFSLPQGKDNDIQSECFFFKDEKFNFGILPNGTADDSCGWLGLFLFHANFGDSEFHVRFGITDNRGEVIRGSEAEWDDDFEGYSVVEFMERTELESMWTQMAPDGYMRIVCEILPPFEEASTQTQAAPDLDKLSQDFKELYVARKDCDLTVMVKGREFRVHRGILRARNPAFDAMLSDDVTESKKGVITVEDFDPEVFAHFLLFLYSGRVENLSFDRMCELYYAADTYSQPELKEVCMQFLKKSLSVTTICDVFAAAVRHTASEILELAIQYFSRNMDEVLITDEWQLFLNANPHPANELIIKGLKLGYTKKN